MKNLPLICLIAVLASGCAQYEFVLVEPTQFARTIGDEKSRFARPPLEYEVEEHDDRLGLAIINPTEPPVRLVGAKSYIVSPDGESHPMRDVSIAPRSYTAALLPPEPPVYRRSGPSFSFGFGVGHYHSPGPFVGTGYYFYDEPFYHAPQAYHPVDLPPYWGWETGPVRIRFSYEQDGTNTFEHDFVFERRKVK